WIPSLLRDLTSGQEVVNVAGSNVRQVIEALEQAYPGIKDRLCDANGLRRSIAVAVDTQMARLGLLEPVGENSEVHFLPSISGGQESTPGRPADPCRAGRAGRVRESVPPSTDIPGAARRCSDLSLPTARLPHTSAN